METMAYSKNYRRFHLAGVCGERGVFCRDEAGEIVRGGRMRPRHLNLSLWQWRIK